MYTGDHEFEAVKSMMNKLLLLFVLGIITFLSTITYIILKL